MARYCKPKRGLPAPAAFSILTGKGRYSNMIKFKDKILENYSIDPVTAIITNSKGEIQETTIRKDGRPYFKGHTVHELQMHTHIGYKRGFDIHHIDENKMNNSLSNLVYLTKSEHTKIHHKCKTLSDETKQKMSEAHKNMSEETKRKLSESVKGKIWINNGVISKRVQFNEDIPAGFSRGRLKK